MCGLFAVFVESETVVIATAMATEVAPTMARRRSFYARDSHGRFARTNTVYRKKSSTKRKVAIAGAAAVAVGGAYVGAHHAYSAGARKGWEIGKMHGVKEATPHRGTNGRMRPKSEKRDYSQNPFAKGYAPFGKEGRARKLPKVTPGSMYRTSRQRSRRREKNFAAGRKVRR